MRRWGANLWRVLLLVVILMTPHLGFGEEPSLEHPQKDLSSTPIANQLWELHHGDTVALKFFQRRPGVRVTPFNTDVQYFICQGPPEDGGDQGKNGKERNKLSNRFFIKIQFKDGSMAEFEMPNVELPKIERLYGFDASAQQARSIPFKTTKTKALAAQVTDKMRQQGYDGEKTVYLQKLTLAGERELLKLFGERVFDISGTASYPSNGLPTFVWGVETSPSAKAMPPPVPRVNDDHAASPPAHR